MINLYKTVRLLALSFLIYYSLFLGYSIAVQDITMVIISLLFVAVDFYIICDSTNNILWLEFDKVVTEIKQEIINIQIQKLKDSLK